MFDFCIFSHLVHIQEFRRDLFGLTRKSIANVPFQGEFVRGQCLSRVLCIHDFHNGRRREGLVVTFA